MKDHILALDQGTTSSRAIVFDRDANPVASAQQELTQHYPRPGWVEHDPEDIWSSQIATVRQALSQASTKPERLLALGVTNQRETTLLWDRATGEPVYNAIVWQCRRTAGICDQLRARSFAQEIHSRTGLVLDPYFSATKLVWLLENIPGLRLRAQRGDLAFGTVDTFLIWRLTGGELHVTDPSNASRTMLFNIHTLAWDDVILKELKIPEAILPRVVPSSKIVGTTRKDLFGAPIPIAGIAGDQQAATFGQTCFSPGMVKNTYGTGCFMLINTGKEPVLSEAGLLSTIGWQLQADKQPSPPVYCLEGSVFIAGAAVQWLRDGLQLIDTSEQIESLAASVPDSGGIVFVPAFVGLGAPLWDPTARGILIGITRGTTAAHIARATLEAIAFQTQDLLEALRADADNDLSTLKADGGAAKNDLLLQIQADVLGIPVQRPVITETTALGVAFLAGLAANQWKSTAQLAELWQLDKEFSPRTSVAERETQYAIWKRALQRSQGWAIPSS